MMKKIVYLPIPKKNLTPYRFVCGILEKKKKNPYTPHVKVNKYSKFYKYNTNNLKGGKQKKKQKKTGYTYIKKNFKCNL